MKIIIVGGGIAGLSAYLSLRQSFAHDPKKYPITIYEKHVPKSSIVTGCTTPDEQDLDELSSSTAIVGGGLGMSPNGMRILKELSQDLHDAVVKQGFPCEKFTFKSWRGWELSCVPTSDMRREEGEEVCVASSRYGLWKCLMDEVGKDVLRYKTVVEVIPGEGDAKPRVRFSEEDGGGEEEADLVIGADGVKSVVKDGIFGKEEYKPVYEELLGVGGFVDAPAPPKALEVKSMISTFGRNGFFGYAPLSPTKTMWWSTVQASALPSKAKISLSELRDRLQTYHGDWKDPFIRQIIEKVEVSHVYPTWTQPHLPYWSKGGCVLVGDAAHALQPTSGQGSSQALEDAKTLSICLSKYLAQTATPTEEGGSTALTLVQAVDKTSDLYYRVRSPRLDSISARTAKMAQSKKEMGLAAEMAMAAFLWLAGKVPAIPKMLIGDVNKELYLWDVHAEIEKVLREVSELR